MTATAQLATRDRLVLNAADLFHGRSYTAVGVNEICEAAGAQKGSFYHFFPTKSDLAIAVIDYHAARMWELNERLEADASGPVGRLRVTGQVVDEMESRQLGKFGRIVGCPIGNLAVELAATDDPAGRHVSLVMKQWEDRIRRNTRDAAAAGLLATGVDPDVLARQVMATMQGMVLLAKAGQVCPEPISAFINRVVDYSLVHKVPTP